MKQSLKKLLLVVLALIVVFAYTKITGTDSSYVEPAQNSGLVLQEDEDPSKEASAEEPLPSGEETPEGDEAEDIPAVEEPAPEEKPEVSESEPAEEPVISEPEPAEEPLAAVIDEDGVYTTKEDVALYIHTYGKLPSNFITKKEAQNLGWSGGSLEPYAPGKCIGGSHFGNYEGVLPEADGRSYTECDINTLGAKSRGAERIVFSNDGLIYYTNDHYESFTLLYGEE